jgi:carbonic anhydrase/acetyltransferase-like protein (isoleucine patch superfamily)
VLRSLGGKEPRLHPDCFVSEAAYLVGEVVIGARSSVWPMAVLRAGFAPIVIGENSHVEDGCVVHSGDRIDIGDNVTFGHCAVIHCRSVGANTLIGNNATLLDGAEIGSHCLVAANALVPPGAKVPDYSFVVGVPGQIKPINEAQLGIISHFLQGYADLAARHKAEGLGHDTSGAQR